MTPDECFAEVVSLLPTLQYARAFNSSVEAIRDDGATHQQLILSPEASAAAAAPPSSEAPGSRGTLPMLHILCRESDVQPAGYNHVSVDGLGSSGVLSGRGYFEPTSRGGAMHILADRVPSRADLSTLLNHELVHAVDASVHSLDLSTCAALACSEIRAASSAECSASWPTWYRALCVRNRAVASTAMVFPEHGFACVDVLYSKCSAIGVSESPLPIVSEALRAEAQALDASTRRSLS
jgi:hypothetical protein